MPKTKQLFAAAALAVCGVTSAQAALVQITMGGANFNFFEGAGAVCDSGGGLGCFSNADQLTSMSFFVDGVLQGTLAANIGLNLLLQLPGAVNPTVNGSTALLPVSGDIFDAQINGNPGLFTNVIGGNVTFSNTGGTFNASGTSSIFAQAALPFGVGAAVGPIAWGLTGTGGCTGAAGDRTCAYAGTAQMSWNTTPVPEPTSLLLAAVALLGAAASQRRRTPAG